jgi:hypothetical protein
VKNSIKTQINSDIYAASGPRPVVRVEAGTYAAFTVTPGLGSTLRVLADGSGPVVIDTSVQPVTLLNLAPSDSVELSDLVVGDGSGTNAGVVVQGSNGTVVLDELLVQGGVGAAGIVIDDSLQVAIQRTTAAGSPGLDVTNGSTVFASKGSVGDLDVRGFSTATTCELTAIPNVEAGSTHNVLSGLMPNVDAPEFSALGGGFSLTVSGEVGDLWFLFYSFNLVWLPLPPPGFEMIGLTGVGVTILSSGFFATGSQVLPLGLPAAPSFDGLPILIQGVGVDPVTLGARFSNVVSIVGLNP